MIAQINVAVLAISANAPTYEMGRRWFGIDMVVTKTKELPEQFG